MWVQKVPIGRQAGRLVSSSGLRLRGMTGSIGRFKYVGLQGQKGQVGGSNWQSVLAGPCVARGSSGSSGRFEWGLRAVFGSNGTSGPCGSRGRVGRLKWAAIKANGTSGPRGSGAGAMWPMWVQKVRVGTGRSISNQIILFSFGINWKFTTHLPWAGQMGHLGQVGQVGQVDHALVNAIFLWPITTTLFDHVLLLNALRVFHYNSSFRSRPFLKVTTLHCLTHLIHLIFDPLDPLDPIDPLDQVDQVGAASPRFRPRCEVVICCPECCDKKNKNVRVSIEVSCCSRSLLWICSCKDTEFEAKQSHLNLSTRFFCRSSLGAEFKFVNWLGQIVLFGLWQMTIPADSSHYLRDGRENPNICSTIGWHVPQWELNHRLALPSIIPKRNSKQIPATPEIADSAHSISCSPPLRPAAPCRIETPHLLEPLPNLDLCRIPCIVVAWLGYSLHKEFFHRFPDAAATSYHCRSHVPGDWQPSPMHRFDKSHVDLGSAKCPDRCTDESIIGTPSSPAKPARFDVFYILWTRFDSTCATGVVLLVAFENVLWFYILITLWSSGVTQNTLYKIPPCASCR